MGGAGDLLGREAEMEYAAEIADAAVGGTGRVLLLLGEAGIGKSSLGRWIGERSAASGAVVVRAACSGAAGPPWSPWAATVAALGLVPGGRPAAHPAHERALSRLMTCDASEVDDDLHPGLVAEALAATLVGAAASRPTMIIIEDVHDADPASLGVLPLLDRAVVGVPLLVVATARTPDAHRRADFTAALAATAGYAVIALRPLRPLDTLELVRRFTETAVADVETATAVVDATGGNPLFAIELGRLLGQTGSVTLPVSAADLPRTGAIIRHRLAGVDHRARQVLELAAVAFPAPATVALLATAAGTSRSAVLELIEGVVHTGLIRSDGGTVTFVHALVRDELCRQIPPRLRQSLHRDLGAALLADSNAAAEHVAHHLLRADDPDSSAEAGRLLRLSATRARALGAYDAAERRLDLVQELLPPDSPAADRLEVLLALADCRFRLGHRERGREAAARAAALARESEDATALARSVLVRREHAYVDPTAMDPEIVGNIDEALAAVGGAASRERSMLLAQRAIELMFSSTLVERRALAEEAVAIARELRDEVALGYALRSLAVTLPIDELDMMIELADELVALAARLGDPMLELHGRGRRASAYLTVGDAARFDEEVAAVRSLAERGRQPVHQWAAGVLATSALLRRGAIDDAETLADEVGSAQEGATLANRFNALVMGRLGAAVARGRPDDAIELATQLYAAAPAVPVIRSAYALAAAMAGRPEEALSALPSLVASAKGWQRDLLWLPSVCFTSWAVAILRRPAWAAELLPVVQSAQHGLHVSTSMGHPVDYWGPVAFYLGCLQATAGQHADADASFADAASECVRVGARAFLVQVRLATARALLERSDGDRSRAAELLALAATAADELGLGSLADDARRLTSSGGAAGEDVVLVERGGDWELHVGNRSWRLRNGRGAAYLAALVERDGSEIHVLDLVAEVGGGGLVGERLEPGIDSLARDRVMRRLRELKGQADVAESVGDLDHAAVVRAEMEELARYLLHESTPAGKLRMRSPVLERARTATTKALRRVIDEISDRDVVAGREIDGRTRTGTFCSYDASGGTGRRVKVRRDAKSARDGSSRGRSR